MEAVLDDPYILITDKKISNIQEVLPILEKIVQAGKKLVVCRRCRGRSLGDPAGQQAARNLHLCRGRNPGFGDRRKAMLQDIAILTGGQVITEELGLDLKETTIEQAGRARQVKIKRKTPLLSMVPEAINLRSARIGSIRAQIEETTSDFDREKLQERLAKLSGGVAVIRVGAATETEMRRKNSGLKMRWQLPAPQLKVLWPVAEPFCSMSFRKLHPCWMKTSAMCKPASALWSRRWKSPCARS